VRHQVVGQQHRLGLLEVGVPGQVDRVLVRARVIRAGGEHVDQVEHAVGDDLELATDVCRKAVATWSLRERPVCS
jgi:hypothetical protein